MPLSYSKSFATQLLTNREKEIFLSYYSEGKSIREIANDFLVTPERILQLLNKIQVSIMRSQIRQEPKVGGPKFRLGEQVLYTMHENEHKINDRIVTIVEAFSYLEDGINAWYYTISYDYPITEDQDAVSENKLTKL